MSDLALFANKPAYFRDLELDETTKSLMGAASYKRISIRGGVFRMVINGKEIAVNENRTMNVIVVAAAPHVNRAYYSGTYTEGETSSPTCMSNDGEKPTKDSKEPQAKTCMDCKQNIKGSGIGDARACRFQRRLAVVLENDTSSGDVYQLTLPAKSIFGTGENGKMPLEQYAKYLGGHGVPITAVVTELRFDTSADTPKLTFRAIRPLTEEEYRITSALGKSKDAMDAIVLDSGLMDRVGGEEKELIFEQPKQIKHEVEEPKKEAVPVKVVKKPVEEPIPEPTKRASKKPVVVEPEKDEEEDSLASILAEWDDD